MGLRQTKPDFTFTITAGQWRGRKLPLPVTNELRPTKEMVRQAGLDMLASRVDLSQARAADVCCGSGAWGLELLSRGTPHVSFVDTNTSHVRDLLQTLEVTPLQCDLITSPVNQWQPDQPIDVIIADPPYDTTLGQYVLDQATLWGHPKTWWLLETATGATLDIPEQLELVKQQRYGRSQLWLLTQRWAAGL